MFVNLREMVWGFFCGAPRVIWAVGVLILTRASALNAGTTVEWKGGEGAWETAAMWGGALPSRTADVRINGTREKPSEVILTHTNVLVTRLDVGGGGNVWPP